MTRTRGHAVANRCVHFARRGAAIAQRGPAIAAPASGTGRGVWRGVDTPNGRRVDPRAHSSIL